MHLLDGGETMKVLHIAPEPLIARRISGLPHIQYVSGDLSGDVGMRLDVTDLPFADSEFDVVLCSHVLEHVPDDNRAMRELARVLRGWGVIQVPIFPGLTVEDPAVTDPRERFELFGQEDHVRKYGADYADRLRRAGFDVTIDDYARQLPAQDSIRWGLDVDEVVHLVTPADPDPTVRFGHGDSA